MKSFQKTALAACLATTAYVPASFTHAIELGKVGDTTVKVGGYVKLDAIMSNYSDGSLGAGNLGRDFYVPSLTPVGGESANNTMDMHAKQTRFNLGTTTTIGEHTLKTFIELDFQVTPNGNERVSNSYSPRLRHAFLSYDKWLFGQTWSTFQNVGALPETVDFIGNTDFGIFVRQAQVRYTTGNFQFAVENPETTVTPFEGGGRIVTDQNPLPDFVGRYNHTAGDLSLSAAVLARQLAYNNTVTDSSTSSIGFSLSGKWKIGEDDIRFGVNTGSGMGRYIGLNVANGAVMDDNGDLEAINSTAFYAAYRHLWNSEWRSNISYSTISIDNDTDLTGTAVTDMTDSLRVNLLYSPVKSLSLGGEYTLANRELASGADGSMNRLQFMAKLAF